MEKIFLCMLLLLTMGLSCKDEPTKPTQPQIQLTVEDASCTEVWLKLSVKNIANPTVQLKRNDSLLNTYILYTPDTTIVDEGLLPNRTYTYTASLLIDSKTYNSTTQTRTMDTTSHNFSFQTFTLGDGSGSSCLYDIAIINDTLAYAVGEIYKNGTSYNVAKWNGQSWELMRLLFTCRLWWPDCWPADTNAYSRGYSIYAFNSSDIWVAAGAVFHFNGSVWEMYAGILGAGSANKIWGSSSSNLYFVGNNGLIAHYNGSSWTKIESPASSGTGGTGLPINDIWGSVNEKTGQTEILAVASTVFEVPPGKRVFKIERTNAVTVADDGLPWSLSGIWFSNKTYFIVGDGAYRCRNIGETWNQVSLIQKYKEAIRGQKINDIIIAGHFGLLLHFNGYNWKDYSQQIYMPNGSFFSIAIRNNLIAAVGNVGGAYAVIAVGRR